MITMKGSYSRKKHLGGGGGGGGGGTALLFLTKHPWNSISSDANHTCNKFPHLLPRIGETSGSTRKMHFIL